MKKWKMRSIVGIVILIAAAAGGLSMFKAVQAETVTVKKTNVTATVEEKGRVVSLHTANIFSEVQGKVKKVYVDEGDAVTQGKLLAEIDGGDLEAQITQLAGELKAIEGSGEAAQSMGGAGQVKQLEMALEQAQLSFNQTKSDYDRTQRLYNEGAVPFAQYEQAKTGLETRQKALMQAEAALVAARKQSRGSSLQTAGQRESIQARLNHLREQVNKTKITAGGNGVVFVKKIKAGDYIAPGAMLFTIGNAERVKIEAYVSTKDRVNLRTGNAVTVLFKLPGEDKELPGVITKIAPAAEERESALGILEDKVKVTLELKQYPQGIPVTPGTNVDVTFTTQMVRGVPAISNEAVFTDQEQDYVWVVRNGKATIVRVETGVEGDELVEIRSGLAEGDAVVLNPHQQELKEGVKVK